MRALLKPGIWHALLAAALFGASVPLGKWLLGSVPPLVLAALLYLGAGVGLGVFVGMQALVRRRAPSLGLAGRDWRYLALAIFFGAVLAPVLSLIGLRAIPAANAALLLNFEGMFSALLAFAFFAEPLGRRVVVGMLAVTAGGALLSWQGAPQAASLWGSLAVIGACFAWGLDNNFTRKIANAEAVPLAAIKGAIGGSTLAALAVLAGHTLPPSSRALAGAAVGAVSYGASLALFIVALRHIGTARTSAYFSAGPFVGAALALWWLGEPASPYLLWGAVLMALGIWLHLSEHHEHWHVHERLAHTHAHVHDEHHRHTHDFAWDGREPHTHAHVHEPLEHSHAHYPDLHHRHRH